MKFASDFLAHVGRRPVRGAKQRKSPQILSCAYCVHQKNSNDKRLIISAIRNITSAPPGSLKDNLNYLIFQELRFFFDASCTTVAPQSTKSAPLKTPPAFDAYDVLGDAATPENKVFGDIEGNPSNFTEFSLRKRLGNPNAMLSDESKHRIYLMNPMNFIREDNKGIAEHWYIRHGARDRDTSFLVPVNLATLLRNKGYDVDFALPWNRPHSGDYNLDDLFAWIEAMMNK